MATIPHTDAALGLMDYRPRAAVGDWRCRQAWELMDYRPRAAVGDWRCRQAWELMDYRPRAAVGDWWCRQAWGLMDYRPQAAVGDWRCRQALEGTFVAAIIEMELRNGIAIMTEGRRRCRLSREVDDLPEIEFGGRVLSFDSAAASAYAVIAA